MNPAAINLAGSVIVPFATNRSKTTSAPQASDFLSRVSHASAAAARGEAAYQRPAVSEMQEKMQNA